MLTTNNGLDSQPVLGGYKVVGDSGVSAQMMFLGTENTVFILDSECISHTSAHVHWSQSQSVVLQIITIDCVPNRDHSQAHYNP